MSGVYSQFGNYGLTIGEDVPKYKRFYYLDYWFDPIREVCVRISLPIALDFTVSRNNLASNNKCTLKLYNLSQRTRDAIFKDELDVGRYYDPKDSARFTKSGNFVRTDKIDDPLNKDHRKLKNKIELWMGYESTSTKWLIFSGYVLSAYSYRSGVDWITEISGYTVNLRDPTNYYCFTANEGMSKAEVIKKVASQMLGVQEIHINPNFYNEFLEKDEVYMGTAQEILTDHLGYKPYVDNTSLNVLSDETILTNEPILINSKKGLLASPRRTTNGVKISMLFEPSLRVGNIVSLDAEREKTYNKCQFSISGFVHKGSVAVNKDSPTTTELELWKGQPGFFKTCKDEIINTIPLKTIEWYEGTMGSDLGTLA